MKITFFKYQGTGNDFIMIDNRSGFFPLSGHIVRSLCDRKFGIGADGLILMNRSGRYDFKMIYHNSNGDESTMCGNGGRCLAAFARRTGSPGLSFTFEAIDGLHHALIVDENSHSSVVRLKMKDVVFPEIMNVNSIIDSGSPHVIKQVKNLKDLDIRKLGREIRFSDPFREQGVNVNFIETTHNRNYIRTYERGVEDETLSCGTGTVASALLLASQAPESVDPIQFQTLGGELTVHFKRSKNLFHDVWLEGPASFVFQGEIII
ncbi:MAG TPA: diaminopimelate epimerase [Bacteroidales bacterium]|nr:diaminopimelate epimerase [Bacteroidales bacterium]